MSLKISSFNSYIKKTPSRCLSLYHIVIYEIITIATIIKLTKDIILSGFIFNLIETPVINTAHRVCMKIAILITWLMLAKYLTLLITNNTKQDTIKAIIKSPNIWARRANLLFRSFMFSFINSSNIVISPFVFFKSVSRTLMSNDKFLTPCLTNAIKT